MAKDYAVGYKRPPQASRFKKGRSGNPKGRPKDARDLNTELMEELAERITVSEGGRTKRVSKQRAIIKRLTERALKGDTRSATVVINMVFRLFHEDEASDASVPDLSREDAAILQAYLDSNQPGSGGAEASGPAAGSVQGDAEPTALAKPFVEDADKMPEGGHDR